jgi:general stress protein 26
MHSTGFSSVVLASVPAMSTVDRPSMVAGYGIATGSEGQVGWDWVASQLGGARNYWVATTRAGGRPHVMPVWGLWLGEAFWFSTDPESTKARNLARKPDVVVHLESGDDVVVLEGVVQRATVDDVPADFVDVYEAKYDVRVDTSDPDFAFYQLRPVTVIAWQEADFPTSATRFRFDD